MIYEIINPSDAMTLEADDSLLASVSIIILSQGDYGLIDEDDRTVLPIFRFSDPEKLIKWLHGNNVDSNKIEEFYAKNGDEMATILESVVYGKIDDRKGIVALTEKMSASDRVEALAKWNESKRSSMNDIGERAHELAKVLRRKAKEAKGNAP